MDKKQASEYIGLGRRLWAWVLDSLAFIVFSVSVLYMIHGRDYFKSSIDVRGPIDILNSFVFPSLTILVFWCVCSATPGKLAISAKIYDAKTGGKPTFKQFLIRYLGYYIALLPLGIGILWIAFDPRKQGWHDKLAGTVVKRVPQP